MEEELSIKVSELTRLLGLYCPKVKEKQEEQERIRSS